MSGPSTQNRTPLHGQAQHALRVIGPPWARRAADVGSAAAVLSLLAGFWYGPVAVALIALVLLGVVVARLAPLPGQLQAAAVLALVWSAWTALLGGFQQVPWLDVIAHALVTGLLAAVTAALLTGPPLRDSGLGLGRRADAVLVTTGLGALLAVVWELAEWVGHTYVDRDIFVSYPDTIADLAAGVVGSLAAGLLLGRMLRAGADR
jgi:hypothetical protein